jgi:thioredoxin-related protein
MQTWRHLIWIAVLVVSLAVAEEPRDPYEHFFDQTFGDFSEELARARDEGKQGVLLFFEMDECPFCHRMKQTVLNQPRVQGYYQEHFLSFAVDVGGDLEITDFNGESMSEKDFAFKQNRVRATPVFQFYDLEGEPVARFTGATSGVEEFLWLGEYVAGGHYREMPFTRYKRERGPNARP